MVDFQVDFQRFVAPEASGWTVGKEIVGAAFQRYVPPPAAGRSLPGNRDWDSKGLRL